MNCGYALFVSTALLLAAFVCAIFRKSLAAILLDIVGTLFYLYPIYIISSIPNTKIAKEITEPIVAHHLPTIAVTVLLAVFAFVNFMCPAAVEKRRAKKAARISEKERRLRDEEKIV